MLKLKPLNELTKVDPTNEFFAVLDDSLPEGHRPLALTDRYSMMTELELSEHVPEDIKDAFIAAKNLWLYGWYYWPFYTLASFHAFSCLEMALRRRCGLDKFTKKNWRKGRSPGLKELLDAAIENKWISDDKIAHAKRQPEGSFNPEDLVNNIETGIVNEPEPWKTENQRYCKILAEAIPYFRNEMAHPAHYWHGMPNSLDFQNTRDLIEQLFAK